MIDIMTKGLMHVKHFLFIDYKFPIIRHIFD